MPRPFALAGRAGPAGAAPLVSRPAGQRLARAELSKSLFHPHESLQQRILIMLRTLLSHLYRAGQAFPGGWWAVVALTALLALAVTAVATQLGPLSRAHGRNREAGRGVPEITADGHRQRARQRAEAGDYSAAILESVRAIGRELEERGVLIPRLGRTATEIAAESAQALPAEAVTLRHSARLFDDICYGGRPGTAAGYAAVCNLDARILAAGPQLAAQAAALAATQAAAQAPVTASAGGPA